MTLASAALDEDFVRDAAAAVLPEAVRGGLRAFAADSGLDGSLLLRGLPVGAIPATPPRPGVATGKDCISEHTLLAVACALGEPIGYVQEHGGGLVQDIVPDRASRDHQVSSSSTVTLAWHTETAFHPHKPRYLLLLCLRGDPQAVTMLCSIKRILLHLDVDTIAVLREPRFRTRPDASFLDGDGPGAFGPLQPVLSGSPARPTFTFDEDLMIGTDPDAQSAFETLAQTVRSHATSVVLGAGDLLVVDNHTTVHARSPFPARFDGSDRWLQRTFVVTDLTPSATEREGRIVTTRFLT
jgi:Taurine catabolism dioxygenase TauD, TfdA family